MSKPRRYPNASLPFVARAHAARAEALDVAERAAQKAAGRCACGLPHLPGEDRCGTCKASDKVKGRALFGRL